MSSTILVHRLFIISQQAAEISAYHAYCPPTTKGKIILSVVDNFVNSIKTSFSKKKDEDASDDINEEEQKFLKEFVFLKGHNSNSGNGDQSSLESQLKTISRRKSFDVKKSFTEDVSFLSA